MRLYVDIVANICEEIRHEVMNLTVSSYGNSTSGAREGNLHCEGGTSYTLSGKVGWGPVVPEAECIMECTLVQCKSVGCDR